MTDNPLPCPFCGASGDESLEVCANVVSCMECGAYGPRQEGIELFCDSRQAIKDWNRRDFSPATIVSGVVSAICRDAPLSPQVTVKPLEWTREHPFHTARTDFGFYSVEPVDYRVPYFELKGTFIWPSQKYPTFEGAKSAAQADFEARIMSALATTEGKQNDHPYRPKQEVN